MLNAWLHVRVTNFCIIIIIIIIIIVSEEDSVQWCWKVLVACPAEMLSVAK